MIITERDGVYSAHHYTGPTHNMLRLKLERGGVQDFKVTVLPPVGECRHHEGLNAEEMLPSIRAGVARANGTLGTDFTVVHAEIVENDNRLPALYEYIAGKIIEEAAKKPSV